MGKSGFDVEEVEGRRKTCNSCGGSERWHLDSRSFCYTEAPIDIDSKRLKLVVLEVRHLQFVGSLVVQVNTAAWYKWDITI